MKMISYGFVLALGVAIGLFWNDERATRAVSKAGKQTRAEKSSSCPENGSQASVSIKAPITEQHRPRDSGSSPEAQVSRLQEAFWEEFNRGENTRAREKVDQMGRLAPTSVEYQESLTRWLVRNREYEEARSALQTCLQLFPKSKSCLLDMADVEMSIGDTDSQLQAIQRCLDVWPNHPLCLNDLAIANMHRGQYETAVEIYQRLPSLNGKYGYRIGQELLQSQLGHALEGAGRIREAWEEFDRACRSNFSDSCSKADDLKVKL